MVGGMCVADGGGVTTTCPVELVKGQDYELRGGGDERSGLVELVNPAGAVTVSFHGHRAGDGDVAREFRAAYSATYHIRVTADPDPGYNNASISTDCRASVKTKCSLTPGVKKTGRNSSVPDHDWYRAALRKGQTYTFTCEKGGYNTVILRDGAGRQLAKTHARDSTPGVIRYRAKASGTYYLDVSNDRGGYTISVR
jgi:hypothetical protein